MADVYMKIEGIDGEARDAKHVGWIQLLNFSHAVSNDVTGHQSMGGHHTSGRCHHDNISVVKSWEGSSPTLYLACSLGKSYPKATLEFMRAGGAGDDSQCYQRIECSDITITSVRPFASVGDDFPKEEVVFTYGTIKWTHTKTDTKGNPTGEVVTGWDAKQNKPL